MAILKWQKGANEWVQLYGDILRNRLRRDKNLSDLTDAEAARKNLGLFGDIVEHNHDTLYKPIFERMEGKIDREIEERRMSEKNISNDLRARAEAAVSAAIASFGVSISQEASTRKSNDDKLELKIGETRLDFTNALTDESNARMNAKKELVERIEDERRDREGAIDQEVKDRDDAIQKALQKLAQEIQDRKDAIAQEVADRDAAISRKAIEIKGWVDKEQAAREKDIADLKAWVTSLMTAEQNTRTAEKAQLDATDNELRNLIGQRFKEAIIYVNNTMLHYFVGTQPPANPVNNKTIWFDITEGSEDIKIFKGNRWVLFGAGYL